MKVLVTGVAGFIGFHVVMALFQRGDEVIGIDNLNDYYDVSLKKSRLNQLKKYSKKNKIKFNFYKIDIANHKSIDKIFKNHSPQRVIHLAAQAGVRYSIENPRVYAESNLLGFTNILEACRYNKIEHLVYASSSSVYGASTKIPFSENDPANHPLQFYAATKRANELMAHSYSHLFNLSTTGLRFFTVYGPWGRPDMALFTFTKNILEGKPIKLFNNGIHTRDFTYIDDVVDCIIKVIVKQPSPNREWEGITSDPSTSLSPFKIYNVGSHTQVKLIDYIEELELALGKKAIKEYMPLQLGDIPNTFASLDKLRSNFDITSRTPISVGVRKFVEWYHKYY